MSKYIAVNGTLSVYDKKKIVGKKMPTTRIFVNIYLSRQDYNLHRFIFAHFQTILCWFFFIPHFTFSTYRYNNNNNSSSTKKTKSNHEKMRYLNRLNRKNGISHWRGSQNGGKKLRNAWKLMRLCIICISLRKMELYACLWLSTE